MIPDFAGNRISQIEVEHLLRLWTDSGWQFNLEGDVRLQIGGAETILDTAPSAEVPVDLALLIGATIEAVTITEAGHLTIRLDCAQIKVAAETGYEAWQILGPRGEIVVCMPGGELAVWGPRID